MSRNNFTSDVVYALDCFDGSSDSVTINIVVPTPTNPPSGGSTFGGSSGGRGGNTFTIDYVYPLLPEPIEVKPSFDDVAESHWAFNAIEHMYALNVVNGSENGGFLPEYSVTHEDLVKMAALYFNIPVDW